MVDILKVLKEFEKPGSIPIVREDDFDLWQTLGEDLIQDETPKASNESGTREYFEERKKYRDFYKNLSVPAPIDLWGKKKFYGRVDTNGNVMVPIPESTILLTNDVEQTQYRVFDFVAAAFREFQTYYKLSKMRGLVLEDKNPRLANIQPYRGWDNPLDRYLMHVDDLEEGFVNRILLQRNNKS